MTVAFSIGIGAYINLKRQKLTEEQERATKAVIIDAYQNLMEQHKEIEAYALFRIATEVFTEDYNTLIGLKHTRLTDFT